MFQPENPVEISANTKLTFRENIKGRVNNDADEIRKQIRKNIRRPLPQLNLFPPNDYKVALLCGGPSLKGSLPDIKRLVKRQGYKIATVNGTYQWALDNKLKPSVFAMLDSRECNARFLSTPVDGCKYVIASHCHPSVFDMVKDNEVYVWHTASERDMPLLDKYYFKRWVRVPGGSTIGSRMIFMLYLLGVRTIRVYGMDCCYAGNDHHAYTQPENDSERVYTAKVGRRKFKAAVWMIAQLDEFLQMAPQYPPDLNISFEGDGLLQYVVQETVSRGRIPRISYMEN